MPSTGPERPRMPGVLTAGLLYTQLVAWLLWPLPARLFSHLPLGVLREATVPYFNLWTLEWNADRLLHGYAGYWDAPLFYPARDAFALSEPQGLTGLLFAPLRYAFGPIAAYNLTLACLLTANAFAGRYLLRVLGASRFAATSGGALMLMLPLVTHELGVLQLCAAWPALLGLSEIARLASKPDPAALVRLGLWTAALAWSCIYYALFFGVLVALAALVLLRRELLAKRMLAAGVLSLGLLVGGLWPLMAAEHRAVSEFQRSPKSIHSGSASALAYLQFPYETPLGKLLPGLARSPTQRSLYPGLLSCALAALGVARVRRLRRRPRFWIFCLVGGLAALYLSAGTRFHLGDVEPYSTTARYLPGFGQLRSPYRAALFVHAFVVVLAAFGLDELMRLATRRQLRAPQLMAATCLAFALFDVTPLHSPTERFPHEVLHEPWIPWLAAQPAGPVAMIPPAPGQRSGDYVDMTLAMLQGLRHGHPIVNGYSGFFPPLADRIANLLRRFPVQSCLRILREHGVRYAVVDKRWPQAGALGDKPARGVTRVFESGRRSVYRIDPR